MGVIDTLRERAQEIRGETEREANTALRVGGLLVDLIDYIATAGWDARFNLNRSGWGEGRTYLRLFTVNIPQTDGDTDNIAIDLMLTGKESIPGGLQAVFTCYLISGILYRIENGEFYMNFKAVARIPYNASGRYGRVFIRREAPGSDCLEVWASMESYLSGTCGISGSAACTVTNDAQTDMEPDNIVFEIEPVEII